MPLIEVIGLFDTLVQTWIAGTIAAVSNIVVFQKGKCKVILRWGWFTIFKLRTFAF
jgi:hypothetical protein